MKWHAPDRYHIVSDPSGYKIAVYRTREVRDLVAWKGQTAIGQRNGLVIKEQYEVAIAELKNICENDAKKVTV